MVLKESEGDRFFSEKIRATRSGAFVLDSDDLSEDDSEDENYNASPIKTHRFLESERGSPMKQVVSRSTRSGVRSFESRLLLADTDSDYDSHSDPGAKEGATHPDTSVEQSIRGQIYEKLTEAAKMMGMLPDPLEDSTASLYLMADGLLPEGFPDITNNASFKDYILLQSKLLAKHRLQQAEKQEKRKKEKENLKRERERAQAYTPGGKRPRIPPSHLTELRTEWENRAERDIDQ